MNDLESVKVPPSLRLRVVAQEIRANPTPMLVAQGIQANPKPMLLTRYKTHNVYTCTAYE